MKLFAALCLALALPIGSQQPASIWTASWASSMMAPEPQNNQPGIDPARLTDTTIREIVHLSVGGSQVRLHLSNAFGTQPLVVDSVYVARPVSTRSSTIVTGSQQQVLFGGQPSVTIPTGAGFLSDPIAFQAAPLSDLVVSFHLLAPPSVQTLHAGSHATTWLLHGEHAPDSDLPNAEKIEHWYQLAAVDVLSSALAETIVAFGDSITDGHASVTGGNTRWPDFLAARLQADPRTSNFSVVNEGIGGNHLLTGGLGTNALSRMDRDVLAQSNIRTIILLEGINDIGMLARGKNATPAQHADLVARMISAYQQIVWRAHAHGIEVIGGTLTPFVGSDYYIPTPANEADRQAVNAWIRTPGHFDAVIDFDAITRDPSNPSGMLQSVDSGDHLHPSPEGYRYMANAIPLNLFH
jgi:lysophospholipase L1-like esterase